jgi:diguanylate cyclase (GGDEF)-like protein
LPSVSLRRVLGAFGIAFLAMAPLALEHVLLKEQWSNEAAERATRSVDTQASLVEARLTSLLERLLNRTTELASDDTVQDVASALPDGDSAKHIQWRQRAQKRLADVVRFIEPGTLAWVVGPDGAPWAASLDDSASALLAGKKVGDGIAAVSRPMLRGRVRNDRNAYLELAAPVRPRSSVVGNVAFVVVRVPAEPIDRWLSDAVQSLRSDAWAIGVEPGGQCIFDTRAKSAGEPLAAASGEEIARLGRDRVFGADTDAVLRELATSPALAKALADSDPKNSAARLRRIKPAALDVLFVSPADTHQDFARADAITAALVIVVAVTAFLFGYSRTRGGDAPTRPSVGAPAMAGLAVLLLVSGATIYVMHALDARGRDLAGEFSRRVEQSLIHDLDAAIEMRAAYFAGLDDRLIAATEAKAEFQSESQLTKETFPEGSLVLSMNEGEATALVLPAQEAAFAIAKVGKAKLPAGESSLARPEVHSVTDAKGVAGLVFDAPFRLRDGSTARLLWRIDLPQLLSQLFAPARTSGFDVSLVSAGEPARALFPAGQAVAAESLGVAPFTFPKDGGSAHRLALTSRVDMFGTQTSRTVVLAFGMFLAVAGAIATSLIVGTLFNYRRASRIDPLTGLRNRMDFSETLAREVERSRRHARLLSLVILDLDHFKRINDQFKHAAGDDLLCAVASELDRTVRKTDSVYRYGGEEFAILLPETNNESARVVIDRVRERFARKPLRGLERLGIVTFSAGVATWDREESTDSLIDRADAAMYEAKNSGRNRVVAARATRKPRRATLERETTETAEAAGAA